MSGGESEEELLRLLKAELKKGRERKDFWAGCLHVHV